VRLTPELKEMIKKGLLAINTQFYYPARLPQKELLHPELPDVFMNYYKAARPLNMFFEKAIGFKLPWQQRAASRFPSFCLSAIRVKTWPSLLSR
jgi:hypothetical protein